MAIVQQWQRKRQAISWASSWVGGRCADRNPRFRNSEIVRKPIRYSDGRQLIFSDNFGQAFHLVTLPEKCQFFRTSVYFIMFYAQLFSWQNMNEVLYNACHILGMNHNIPILIFGQFLDIPLIRTNVGEISAQLLGHETDSDSFFLTVAPLVGGRREARKC